MDKAMLNSLTEAERALVVETEREAMAELDEDSLLELHTRVRRARTKYVKLYRRHAAAQVAERGGRGHAYPTNQRHRDKAEIFELALARVSRRIDVVAKQAAADLKAERLAAARAVRADGPAEADTAPAAPVEKPTKRSRTTKTTGGLKKDASSRALGARRQAKRDSR